MCGICGEIRFDGQSADVDAVGRMTGAMTSRGPDSDGVVAHAERKLEILRAMVVVYRDKMALEPKDMTFDKPDWLITKFGNKISKKSVLCAPEKVSVKGKTIVEARSILRADVGRVSIGQSCIVGEEVVLRPPVQKTKAGLVVIPMAIGDYVVIEKGTIIQAASVGSHIHFGQNCTIGQRSIISNCCRLQDGTVIPPGTVVPPFSIYGGNPGVFVGTLPPSYERTMKEFCDTYFKKFSAKSAPPPPPKAA